MHLPIAHLSGFEEDGSEGQLQVTQSGSQDDEGSQSQGSGKEGSKDGGGEHDGARVELPVVKPPKDLPCPRCQSMNTKFCYYNNYSVNQPRHFCRNCQRYWTVGGTLRNVPVGGGSRKKSSRSRVRADPYYVRGGATDDGHDVDAQGQLRHGGLAMAVPGPDIVFGDPDFGLHPSQISSFLQFALNHGQGLAQIPPFLDVPAGYAMSAEEEAEVQAFYEATSSAQSGHLMSTAAAMMGSGLWVPELEPAHVALMHKAALWAEAQRLQSLARRAQAAAWADQERECKPVVSAPIVLQQRQPVEEDEDNVAAHRQPHRRPGFWETALMHSRPTTSKRPAESSQTWDETSKPEYSGDTLSQNNNNMVAAESEPYSHGQGAYDVESTTTSWVPSSSGTSNPESMFY